jgi:hypothetical protein
MDVLDQAPTEEQFARIGRIHVTWAVIEKLVQHILTRLAFGPDWPTGALSDPLIFDHRLKALVALVEIHRTQLANKFVAANICDNIDSLRTLLTEHRVMRNRLAHWVINRAGEDLGVARFATRLPSPDREDFVVYKTSDLNDHIVTITAIAGLAASILQALPKHDGPFERK